LTTWTQDSLRKKRLLAKTLRPRQYRFPWSATRTDPRLRSRLSARVTIMLSSGRQESR
jgi:hypothetical protein